MTTQAVAPNAPTVDGRRMRADRGREAVVAALLALYAEGVLRPTAASIAARAGVSERSVFRYFDDRESLIQAIFVYQTARIGHLYAIPRISGSRAHRTQALVDLRLDLYEQTHNTWRAAAIALGDSERLQEGLRFRRELLGDQISSIFATEFAGLHADMAAELHAALDVAVSPENIEYMRHQVGYSIETTKSIITRTLAALLDTSKSNS